MGETQEELTIQHLEGRLRHNERYYGRFQNANRAFGAFATAILVSLKTNPHFRDATEHFVEVRRHDMTASHALKLMERAYQEPLMDMRDSADIQPDFHGYPYGFESVEKWMKTLAYIASVPDLDERVHKHLLLDDVQTNFPDRDKTVNLIAPLYADRFDGPPSRLDVGPSIGQGMKLSVYNHSAETPSLGFSRMNLGGPVSDTELTAARHDKFKPPLDNRLSHLANTALGRHLNWGEVRGVDKSNVYDLATKQWVRNSYYPAELVDGKTLPRHDMIASLDPNYERVHMTVADVTTKEGLRLVNAESGNREFDIVTCITMLYQIKDPAERMKLIMSLASLIKEGGIIVIQDALSGNFETPYEYTTYVIDTAHPGWKMEAVLHWETARCVTAVVGQGKIDVKGKKMRLDEAFEHHAT